MMNKNLYIRIQKEPHGMFTDEHGNLIVTYSKTMERNTLHFTVNSIVSDHQYGKHNYDKDNNFKGQIAIIVNPHEAPTPAGLKQNDTWFRMGEIEGSDNLRGINVGKAVVVAPIGTPGLPTNTNIIYYDGTKEQRDLSIIKHLKEQGIQCEECGEYSWRNQSIEEAKNWETKTSLDVYGTNAQYITHTPHFDSVDGRNESNFEKIREHIYNLKKSKSTTHINENTFLQERTIDTVKLLVDEIKNNIQSIFHNTPPNDINRITTAYQQQIELAQKYFTQATEVHLQNENLEKFTFAEKAIEHANSTFKEMTQNGNTFYITRNDEKDKPPFPMKPETIIKKIATGELDDRYEISGEKLGNTWKPLSKLFNIDRIATFKDDPYITIATHKTPLNGNIITTLKDIKESLPPMIKPENQDEIIGLSKPLLTDKRKELELTTEQDNIKKFVLKK